MFAAVNTSELRDTRFSSVPAGIILNHRYLLQRRFNAGFPGGAVYLALDLEQNRFPYILREIQLTEHDNGIERRIRSRLRREAKKLLHLQQPGILAVRSLVRSGTRLFLVQDTALADYCSLLQPGDRAQTDFSEQDVLTLFAEVLPILSAIHSCGVYFRAITPNALVQRYQPGSGTLSTAADRKIALITAKLDFGYPDRWVTSGLGSVHQDLCGLATTGLSLLKQWKDHQANFLPQSQDGLHWAVSDQLRTILCGMMTDRLQGGYASAQTALQDVQTLLRPQQITLETAAANLAGSVQSTNAAQISQNAHIAYLREKYSWLSQAQNHRQFSLLVPRKMRAYITPLSISATLLVGLAKVLSQTTIAPTQDQVWISGTPMSQAEVAKILAQSGSAPVLSESGQPNTSTALTNHVLTNNVMHKTGRSLNQFVNNLKGDR